MLTLTGAADRPARPGAVLAICGLIITVGVLITRAVFAIVVSNSRPVDLAWEGYPTRHLELFDSLPAIAETKGDLLLAFGASATAHDLSPRLIDAWLKDHGIEIVSFSLGEMLQTPHSMHETVLATRAEFRRHRKRARVIAIEFDPTKYFAGKNELDDPARLVRNSSTLRVGELPELAMTAPVETLVLLGMRARGKGFHPEIATNLARRLLYATPGWWPGPVEPQWGWDAVLANARPFYDTVEAQGGIAFYRWSIKTRGESTVVTDRTRADYEALMASFTSNAQIREMTADNAKGSAPAHLDERAVEDDFYGSIADAFTFADTVIAWTAPVRSGYPPTPVAPEDFDMLRARLAKLGIPFHEFHRLAVDDSNFLDNQHLNEVRGRPYFAPMFAQAVRDALTARNTRATAEAP
jgi:hypothetical protein